MLPEEDGDVKIVVETHSNETQVSRLMGNSGDKQWHDCKQFF